MMYSLARRLSALAFILLIASALASCGRTDINAPPVPTPIQEPRAAATPATPAVVVDLLPATPALLPSATAARTKNTPAATAPPSTATRTHDIFLDPSGAPGSSVETAGPAHVFMAFDFLGDYMTNRSYPIISQAKPWTNSTINVSELLKPLGGVTYWDFFSEPEHWDSPSYMWQDDSGTWRPYQVDMFHDGQTDVPAYQLLDRRGPGVMDKLWFTEDAVWMLTTEQSRRDVGPIANMDNFLEWGNLDKLGKLRIEVDDGIAYDGSLQDWLSGKAWGLSPELAQILTWRHRQYGSSGSLLPVLYQKHLRVWVYGGTKKPKWFLATGVRFPDSTQLQSYSATGADLPVTDMTPLAHNVLEPEQFINSFDNVRRFDLDVDPGAATTIQLKGTGTLRALAFRLDPSDATSLWLRVKYGSQVGANLPFIAFFGDQSVVAPHRSTPLGILEEGNSALFYCNYPMPFQDGMTIELTTNGAAPVQVNAALTITNEIFSHELYVNYRPGQKLEMYGPDYAVQIPGDGKLVGLVLASDDQGLDSIPLVYSQPNVPDPVRRAWDMGYLEGNLTLADGAASSRIYGGQEDWADGGFYFNRGYTSPPGGSNRPFGGILRYKDGKEGYATLFRYFDDLSAFVFKNGLTLSFGHGTWNNNFPVRYGTTVYYYQ